jgi:hypothetical protein
MNNENASGLAPLCIAALFAFAIVTASATARPTGRQATLSVVKMISSPGGKGPLSSGRVNTVPAYPNLAFKVVIRNGAAPQHLEIRARITRGTSSLVVTTKTVSLAANRIVSVTFGRLGPVPFAQRTTMKLVIADARTHEQWNLTYPMIFTVP